MTIKATGNQWYWNYTYADNNFSFDSLLLAREISKPTATRLTSTCSRRIPPSWCR